ncbi:Abi family protein [Methylobacterium oryzihabitans]|uniref:Abi family protein n=1 Tax=Methylobacterium oryzihabitans TaxID=2499852 RepID=UPI001651F5BC|nr:Abi family protein [Methylobacterium oryzihabitans]
MARTPFTKPHASANQRVAHLRAKGLDIPRPNVAARKIELIGYERLRIYFLARRQLNAPNRPFVPGTSYRDIIRLYECDTLLRDVCFDAVGQFEILFRNAISEAVSQTYGSHPYLNPAAFRDSASHIKAIRSMTDAYEKSHDGRARHYRETYSDPYLPAIWTVKEFLTFGRASNLYKCLSGPLRTAVAADFGVGSDEVFESWVASFVDLRNICAHHDRLFNRKFQKQPKTLTSASIPTAPKPKLKAILECLDHAMTGRGVPIDSVGKVARIIAAHPEMQPGEAGY